MAAASSALSLVVAKMGFPGLAHRGCVHNRSCYAEVASAGPGWWHAWVWLWLGSRQHGPSVSAFQAHPALNRTFSRGRGRGATEWGAQRFGSPQGGGVRTWARARPGLLSKATPKLPGPCRRSGPNA